MIRRSIINIVKCFHDGVASDSGIVSRMVVLGPCIAGSNHHSGLILTSDISETIVHAVLSVYIKDMRGDAKILGEPCSILGVSRYSYLPSSAGIILFMIFCLQKQYEFC